MWQIEGCVGWIAIAFFNAVAVFYFHRRMRIAERETEKLREQVEKTEFALHANQGLLKEMAEREMTLDILTYISKLADNVIIDTQKISDVLGYKKEKIEEILKETIERKK